ncbi:ribonuclease H [Senna tora]|uniref:Ribonuclease H n=1 Tax=Senna tora TaxID=362788 RepID=A0A834SMI5_9FABA|nr:ribonuclease H [Senna tora]
MWKGISKCWPIVERNIAWNIGDGNRVLFWKDIWISDRGRLIDCVSNQPPESVVDMPVHPSGSHDCVRWRITHDGNFSIRSAYDSLSPNLNTPRPTIWSKIWKWPVHERIRSFICLITHGKILTNSHRRQRNLTDNATFPRCGRTDEKVLHVLRDCDEVAELWTRFVAPQRWNTFFSLELGDWIDWNRRIHVGNELSDNWQTIFGVACWQIWKSRNFIVFENRDSNLQDEPPDHDRVKCNVDVSYFESTRDAACGGVARDASGNFLFSFCHWIGCGEIIRAELRGIVNGLEMLWEKGFHKVMIECDSEVALELVLNGVVDTHPCSALVQRVRSLIDRHWDAELVHVFREANQAVDLMEKLSHSLAEGIHVFDSPHVGLRSILAADLNGPLVPRLCMN